MTELDPRPDPAPAPIGDPPAGASSPDFQAAVTAAVAAAIPDLVKQATAQAIASLALHRANIGEPGDTAQRGDSELIDKLAMAIAEISDQGTHRKRVAPEILAQRAESRRLMIDKMMEARAKHLIPEYKVINKTYLEEVFIEPFRVDPVSKKPVSTEIQWLGVPNECMRPTNDIATEIFDLFVASIGGSVAYGKSKFLDKPGDYGVTAGGLVVKGLGQGSRRTVGTLDNTIPDPFAEQTRDPYRMLAVKQAQDPTQPFIRVLGTVAPPARQNAYGDASPSAVK